MSKFQKYLEAAQWDQKEYKIRQLKKALKETENPEVEIDLKESIKRLQSDKAVKKSFKDECMICGDQNVEVNDKNICAKCQKKFKG